MGVQRRSERAFQVDEELCKRRKGSMATTQHRSRIFRGRKRSTSQQKDRFALSEG
jgi:hypothetical protein